MATSELSAAETDLPPARPVEAPETALILAQACLLQPRAPARPRRMHEPRPGCDVFVASRERVVSSAMSPISSPGRASDSHHSYAHPLPAWFSQPAPGPANRRGHEKRLR